MNGIDLTNLTNSTAMDADVNRSSSIDNDLMVAKVIAMSVLGVASFLLGVLPIKLAKLMNIRSVDGDKNLLISLLLCFGGGVLLFTTFIHLQPEVRNSFSHLEAEHKIPTIGRGIPMSELVFILGFFFVYLIEEVAHGVVPSKRPHSVALRRSLSLRRRPSHLHTLTIPRVVLSNNKLDDGQISYISTSNKELLNNSSHSAIIGRSDRDSNTDLRSASDSSHHQHHHHYPIGVGGSVSGLLAVIALSFHAVFEGLAVGLESDVNNVWYLFAAITTHKLVIAFCVGVELVIASTRVLLVMLYIGTFAVVTPFGIGAGIVLSKYDNPQIDITSVVLQGMAAGTLLYVVFFEVLSREKANHHSGIWQLVAILAGFTVMFVLQVLTGHEHNHDGVHSIDNSHNHHHSTTSRLFS